MYATVKTYNLVMMLTAFFWEQPVTFDKILKNNMDELKGKV